MRNCKQTNVVYGWYDWSFHLLLLYLNLPEMLELDLNTGIYVMTYMTGHAGFKDLFLTCDILMVLCLKCCLLLYDWYVWSL